MERVGGGTARALPAADTATKSHHFISAARVSSRGLLRRRLPLVLLAWWACWRFPWLAIPLLKQHSSDSHQPNTGDPHCAAAASYSEERRVERGPLQMPTAAAYISFPGLLYAAADSHVPAGPELEHRLPMYFEDSPHVIFLLRDWYTDRPWSYALCCCATLLLALFSVLLKGARRKLEKLLLEKSASALVTGAAGDELHAHRISVAPAGATHGATRAAKPMQPTHAGAEAPAAAAPEIAGTAPLAKERIGRYPAGPGGPVQEDVEGLSDGIEVQETGELHQIVQQHPREGGSSEKSGAVKLQGNVIRPAFDPEENVHFPVLSDTAAAAATGAPPRGGLEGPCTAKHGHTTRDNNAGCICETHTGKKKPTNICSTRTSRQEINPERCSVSAAVRGFPVGPNAARAVAAFCNYSVDYLLMLLAMMFNVGIILSLFAGIAIGFLLIGHHLLPPPLKSQSRPFKRSSPDSSRSGSGASGGKTVESSTSSRRNLYNTSSTPKTAYSTTLEIEPNIHTQIQTDKGKQTPRRGVLLSAKQSTGGNSRMAAVAADDDLYWCTYTGTVREEEQGDERNKKEEEDPLSKKRGAEEPLTEKKRSAAAPFRNSDRDDKGINSCSSGSNAITISCIPTAAAPSEASAGGACDGLHEGAGELLATPLAPSDQETSGGAREEMALQPGASSGRNGPSSSAVSGSSRNAVSGTGDGDGRAEEVRRKSSVKESKGLPPLMHPFVGSTKTRAASLRWPAEGGRNQQEATDRREELHRPHLLAAGQTEFQRRPSDCYDMLAVVENLKQLYPADFAATAAGTGAGG